MAKYTFEGGDRLTKIGVAWFVSYAYYEHINKKHNRWKKVATIQERWSIYNKSRQYHKDWLHMIKSMKPGQLNRNAIGLSADEIILMANEILAYMEQNPGWENNVRTPGGIDEKIEAAAELMYSGIENAIEKIDVEAFAEKLGRFCKRLGKSIAHFFGVTIPEIWEKIRKFFNSETWEMMLPIGMVFIGLLILIIVACSIKGLFV